MSPMFPDDKNAPQDDPEEPTQDLSGQEPPTGRLVPGQEPPDGYRTEQLPPGERPTDRYPADQHPTDQHPTDQHPTDRFPAAQDATGQYGWGGAQGAPGAQGGPGAHGTGSADPWGTPPPAADPWGAPPSEAAVAGAAPAGSAPASTTHRRGPGWAGVAGLVMAGMLLSSGITLGGVVAYDQLEGRGSTPTAASSSDTHAKTEDASPVATDGDSPDWEAVADKVSPSTVAISVQTGSGQAEGTGVVYQDDGTIITNNHVVSGAQKVEVSLTDGRTYSARVVGTDPTTDLAVIRLEDAPDGLTPATVGDSDEVEVGEGAMAVGTPLGLANTVTTGIISAVHRPVTTEGESGDGSDATFSSALQTDAAINPGNSGGPLVDSSGAVIGINSSIASFSQGDSSQSGSIGLGFAIPSNTVKLIADQLIDSGSAKHALLGVTAQDGSEKVASSSFRGALVRSVEPKSAASEAGLREGDLITKVDGVPVNGAAALTGMVRGLEVGSTHTLTVVHDQKETEVDVRLAEAS